MFDKKVCPKCGFHALRQEARFCGKCGAKLPTVRSYLKLGAFLLATLVAGLLAVVLLRNLRPSHNSSNSGTHTAPKETPKPQVQPAPTNPDEKAVYDFISGLQAGDFKRVVDLTGAYRSEIDSIKQGNPEVLWPKLTNDYYQKKIEALAAPVESLDPTESFSWDSYFGLLGGMAGNPGLNIRLTRALLPLSCQWRITERRVLGMHDSIRFGIRNYSAVYVEVAYPSIEGAPQLHGKFLKQVILEFSTDADRHLILDVKRVAAGDTFWTPPYPATAIPYLRAKYLGEYARTKTRDEARDVMAKLIALGQDVATDASLDIVGKRVGYWLYAATTLAEGGERRLVPLIQPLLREIVDKGDVCSEVALSLATGLAALAPGDALAVEMLRNALSKRIASRFDMSGGYSQGDTTVQCTQRYVAALAVADGARWNAFNHWSSSGDVFSLVLDTLTRKRELSGLIDTSSPTANSVTQFLRVLKVCNVAPAWRCPARLIVDDVRVIEPDNVQIVGRIEEFQSYYEVKGQTKNPFEMELRGTSNTATPWVISRITLK